MSFGFVRGDRLACHYHSWQYDGSGQCRFIPAHPELEIPETIGVATHLTIEAGGFIWTTLDAEAPPVFGAGHVTPVRSITIDRRLGLGYDKFPVLRRWARRVRQLPGFMTMRGIPDCA